MNSIELEGKIARDAGCLRRSNPYSAFLDEEKFFDSWDEGWVRSDKWWKNWYKEITEESKCESA